METLAFKADSQELLADIGGVSRQTAMASDLSVFVVGSELCRDLRELQVAEDIREIATISEAIDLANAERPAILVMDVSLDTVAARDHCARLRYQPALIFLSNDPLFAQRAFELGAVDCLVKPAQPIRLVRAVQRGQAWHKARLAAAPAESIGANSWPGGMLATRWLRMVRNGVLVVAALDDVVYFQAERKLTRVVLANTDGYLHMGISTVAAKLDSRMFWRIHRSTIVNGRFVGVVQRDDLGRLVVRMHGRTEVLYVSKAHDALARDGIF